MKTSFLDEIKEVVIQGNDMIWIPKFYCLAGQHKGFKTWNPQKPNSVSGYVFYVSSRKLPNFTLHPAFYDENGVEKDGFFVAKYKASMNSKGRIVSKKGNVPLSCSKDEAKQYCETAIGGGQLMTFWQYQAIVFLMNLMSANVGKSTDSICPDVPSETPPDTFVNKTNNGNSGSTYSLWTLFSEIKDIPLVQPNEYKTGDYEIKNSVVPICDLGCGSFESIKQNVKMGYYPYSESVSASLTSGGSLCSNSRNSLGLTFGNIGSINNPSFYPCYRETYQPNNRYKDSLFFSYDTRGNGIIAVGGSLPLCKDSSYNSGGNKSNGWWTHLKITWDNWKDCPLSMAVVNTTDKLCFRFSCYE